MNYLPNEIENHIFTFCNIHDLKYNKNSFNYQLNIFNKAAIKIQNLFIKWRKKIKDLENCVNDYRIKLTKQPLINMLIWKYPFKNLLLTYPHFLANKCQLTNLMKNELKHEMTKYEVWKFLQHPIITRKRLEYTGW